MPTCSQREEKKRYCIDEKKPPTGEPERGETSATGLLHPTKV